MRLRLLPSTFEPDGSPSPRQHLTCFVINGNVAIDAGSLAMAVTDEERSAIRDVVLTHAHLDHIAGLPLFIDDQFSDLKEPVRVHGTPEVIEILERDVFNWSVYPRFSELHNDFGSVMEYRPFEPGSTFEVSGLSLRSLEVNHKVPSTGFIVSDDAASIAITGDTALLGTFWEEIVDEGLSALLIECAFPDRLAELAEMSCHLTPVGLKAELKRFNSSDCDLYAINIKPAYRDEVIAEIGAMGIERLKVLEVGRIYEWGGSIELSAGES